MREVIFRGKSLYTGLCVYGDLLHKGIRAFIEYEVDPATIGQHTGFTDKNAREVYEGDVLTDKFESIGVVEWQNGCFGVNFGDVDVFQISDSFDDSYQMWVIGNIYDNPELK